MSAPDLLQYKVLPVITPNREMFGCSFYPYSTASFSECSMASVSDRAIIDKPTPWHIYSACRMSEIT